MGKQRVIKIIAKRDELTIEEATEVVDGVIVQINEAIQAGDYMEPDEIIMNELQLEPDYLLDLVEFC